MTAETPVLKLCRYKGKRYVIISHITFGFAYAHKVKNNGNLALKRILINTELITEWLGTYVTPDGQSKTPPISGKITRFLSKIDKASTCSNLSEINIALCEVNELKGQFPDSRAIIARERSLMAKKKKLEIKDGIKNITNHAFKTFVNNGI